LRQLSQDWHALFSFQRTSREQARRLRPPFRTSEHRTLCGSWPVRRRRS